MYHVGARLYQYLLTKKRVKLWLILIMRFAKGF